MLRSVRTSPDCDAGVDLELVVAFQRRHLDLVAEGCLGEADVELHVQVVFDALEDRVGCDAQDHVGAAAGAAVGAELAFAGEPDLRPVVDAGRYLDLDAYG